MKPFSHPRYQEYADQVEEPAVPCVHCGKAVDVEASAEVAWVVVVEGGARFALEGERINDRDPGYMGSYPIGARCLRLIRKAVPDLYFTKWTRERAPQAQARQGDKVSEKRPGIL